MTYDLRTRARRALLALTIVLTLGVVVAASARPCLLYTSDAADE